MPKIISKSADKVLSFDMAIRTMSYSFLVKNQLKFSKFVDFTITDLTSPAYQEQYKTFYSKMKELIKSLKPDVVAVERYQNRGRMRGIAIEVVNIQIGIMSAICIELKIPLITLTASTWKNAFARYFGGKEKLKELYKICKPLPDHHVDSHLQGWFIANKDKGPPFQGWKLKQLNGVRKEWDKLLLAKKAKRRKNKK